MERAFRPMPLLQHCSQLPLDLSRMGGLPRAYTRRSHVLWSSPCVNGIDQLRPYHFRVLHLVRVQDSTLSTTNMDDDIQDILNSVSAPSIPQRTRDLQALTRAWVNERTSPELLSYPTPLIERVMERTKKQVRTHISCLCSGALRLTAAV